MTDTQEPGHDEEPEDTPPATGDVKIPVPGNLPAEQTEDT